MIRLTAFLITFHYRCQSFHRVNRPALSDESYTQLHVEQRNANKEEHDEVGDQKDAAARLIHQIGEAPQIAQANAIANA